MSKSLSTFDGDALYVDTTAFYALLRAIDNSAAYLFTQIEAGRFRAFTSALTFDELAYRLLLARIRDQLPGSPLDQLRQKEAELIARFYPEIGSKLNELISLANLIIVAVDHSDVVAMNQIMLDYHLRPRDALHLASMRRSGCAAIVSEDHHFDLVDGIERLTLA